MADDTTKQQQFWIWIVAVAILLIFLYFYRPFETYLVAHIPFIHFNNVVFWFASLVGIARLRVRALAVVSQRDFPQRHGTQCRHPGVRHPAGGHSGGGHFLAGATLQAIEVLSEYFLNRGPIFDVAFGGKLLAIVLLVILAVIFYLLHYVVRALRTGWRPRAAPPRAR